MFWWRTLLVWNVNPNNIYWLQISGKKIATYLVVFLCSRNKHFPALLWKNVPRCDSPAWRQCLLRMPHLQPSQSDGGRFFSLNLKVHIVMSQVSWIRRSDGYPLYIGDERFINDKRFELISTRLVGCAYCGFQTAIAYIWRFCRNRVRSLHWLTLLAFISIKYFQSYHDSFSTVSFWYLKPVLVD